jgi:membrane-bound metal-dependent hydrolase YbcI (DUF457 family)
MPTPVAHSLAGAGIAVLLSRRLPALRALPVAAAILLAANLPDLDHLALVRGREALERFHQGRSHSIVFVTAAAVPLALLLRRRLGFLPAWPLLAAAGISHLALDLMVADRKPPIGFPLFWPFSARNFHAAVEIFPGIDRSHIVSATNLRELAAELAWAIPAVIFVRWWSRRRESEAEGSSPGPRAPGPRAGTRTPG